MKPAARNRHPATYIVSPRIAGLPAIAISNAASNICLATIARLLGHDRPAQPRRIFGDAALERANRAVRIVERTAHADFARVNLIVEAQRMAKLIYAAGTAGAAILDRAPHHAEVAVQEIDVMAVNHEPSSAVHARSPRAERSHQTAAMFVVKLLGGALEVGDSERPARVVIDPEIEVRMLVRGAAGARSSQHDCLHAADARRALDDSIDHVAD
jgi:hypothetical protein